jgi:sulfoxide reductase heme-binding subunit YedZ
MASADPRRFDRLLRYRLKPLVFLAALLPAASLLAGALGVHGFALGANPISAILHGCGKWTLNFLLLTLSIRPLATLTGRSEWLRLRRMLGLFAFTYALLHFLVYLILDQSLDLHAVIKDIAKRPYITIGFTALLMLVPLAATSTGAMMRRLGRRWQKLHRLVYVIAVLGVWHFYWGVKADVREPLIYAAVLGALFALRWRRSRSRPAPAVRQSMSRAEPLRQSR